MPGGVGADADETELLRPAGFPADTRTAALRDPWGESADAEHTHDPHEVTVQLDAVSLQQDMRLKQAAGAPDSGADGSDGPVFVDESGRRSRRFRRLGIAIGLACAVYAVVIVATLLSGSSDAPWLPVPGQQDDQPAGQVDTTPSPGASVEPSGTGSVSPGATPTAGAGTVPTPGSTGTAPGLGTRTDGTGASADTEPTATKTTTKPGTDPSDPDPSTSVVDPPVTESTDPSPTTSPDPSVSTSGGGTGVVPGTVAAGPGEPRPIAVDPNGPAPHSTSPEHIL
ncbi:hypothetical protein [Streptomyces sp. NPDC088794]|uniref:hypothetical protein n=1 Tax=Streptomyces sp. NPDC088794 TaxID=3365902 RepID=UPI00382DFD4F